MQDQIAPIWAAMSQEERHLGENLISGDPSREFPGPGKGRNFSMKAMLRWGEFFCFFQRMKGFAPHFLGGFLHLQKS